MALRIGWFTTARGPGSKGMFDNVTSAIESGKLDAKIEFVFSNRAPSESKTTDLFFNKVKKQKIKLFTLSSKNFKKNYNLPQKKTGTFCIVDRLIKKNWIVITSMARRLRC